MQEEVPQGDLPIFKRNYLNWHSWSDLRDHIVQFENAEKFTSESYGVETYWRFAKQIDE